MDLRKILIFLFICISFNQLSFAQDTNVVKYSLFLEKTIYFGTVDTKITEGTFKEGESFIIPQTTLPSSPINFSIYQELYNALVGGKFSIDFGALDNNILMKIFIRRLNSNAGEYLNLGLDSDTLFSYFEIRIWELPDSNFYPEETSYYLNDGYYARFALPKSQALMNFLNNVGINENDSLKFAFLDNDEKNNNIEDWTSEGIETIDSKDSVKFNAIHLSRIGGGRRNIATAPASSDTTSTDVNLIEIPGQPKAFKLEQNYPNPFNPSTRIGYSIIQDGIVQLQIYNILGQHLFDLVNQYQRTGNYEVEFSNNENINLPSGIYLYVLKTNNYSSIKRMILMK